MVRETNKTKEELLIENEQLKARIIELEKTEIALQESEERLQLTMKATSDGLFDLNLKTNKIYFSPAYFTMLGYDPDEFPHTMETYWSLLHPEDRKLTETRLSQYLSGEIKDNSLEMRFKTKSGEWNWILSRGEVVERDTEGNPVRFAGTNTNIDARKKAEDALSQSHSRERLLADVMRQAPVAVSIGYPDGRLENSNIAASELTGYSLEELQKINWNETLTPSGWKKIEAEKLGQLSPANRTVRYEKEYIRKDGSIVPVELLVSANFDAEGNLSHYIGFATDITNKKKIEADSLKTQADMRTLLENSGISFVLMNPDKSIKAFNNKAKLNTSMVFGKEIKAGQSMLDYTYPENRARFLHDFDECLKGKTVKVDMGLPIQKPEFWFNFSYDPVKDENGKVIGVLFSTLDITDRKKAEEKISYQAKLLNVVDQAVISTDPLGKVVYINPAAEKIYGWSTEEVLGKTANEMFSSPKMQEYGAEIMEALQSGNRWSGEFIVKNKAGHEFWVDLTDLPITDENGKITGIIGVSSDITERKKAEEALKESEGNLKNTFNLSPSIITKANLNTGFYIEVNQAVTRILGYSIKEFTSKPYTDLVHPDDIQKTTGKVSEQTKGNEVFTFENRFLCKDGSYKWLSWNATAADSEGIAFGVASDITERKLADEALKKSSEKHQTILRTAISGFWITNKKGELVEVNDSYCQMSGYTKDELLSMKISDLEIIDTAAEIKSRINKITEVGSDRFESKHIRKDGSVYNVEINIQYQAFDGGQFICFIDDITERKQAQQELIIAKEKAEENELQFKQLVENMADAVFIADTKNGIILDVNRAAERLMLMSKNDIIGLHQSKLHPQNSDEYSRTTFNKHKEALKKSVDTVLIENKIIRKDGVEVPIEILASKVKYKGNDCLIGTFRDISDRKKAELELLAAKEKAEESDRLKSAFLANMSHEIRTPMNGILGFTNLLQEPNLNGEKQQKYVEIIKKSGNRMLSTVNDIIDISRIESGLVELSVSEVNIHEQMEYMQSFFKPEAATKGIRLIFKNDSSQQYNRVITDLDKFNSIITNLIKNAIKFTHQGTIELGYKIKNENGSAKLEFYVKDTGIGILKDRQEAIFDRFVQADIDDKDAKQGSGLGLAISKAYAEMLGGKIWVESEVGKGSTFYFTIEYKSVSESKSDLKKDGQLLKEDISSKKLKILVVEDDETSKNLLSILIEKFAKKIINVSSGLKAVEVCQNNPDIDLILMDIQLPDMNGYEATRQIRQFNKDVVILAQTAYALAGDKEKAIGIGCNDYISKPITKSELDVLIKKYLID